MLLSACPPAIVAAGQNVGVVGVFHTFTERRIPYKRRFPHKISTLVLFKL